MQEIVKGDSALIAALAALCGPEGAKSTTDMAGNGQHWFELASTSMLSRAAQALKERGARLSLISGFTRGLEEGTGRPVLSACYTFVLGGEVYCVTANMSSADPSVPSITRWFANADWHEREMRELVGIRVSNQPHPERLFLNPELDGGSLGHLVPLSVMMNAACSKDLWEHILSTRQDASAGRD